MTVAQKTTKSVYRRLALRAAARIHEHLQGSQSKLRLADVPEYSWHNFQEAARLAHKAQARNWHAAYVSALEAVDYPLRQLIHRLENYRTLLETATKPCQAPSAPGAIAADLLALQDEFTKVSIDLAEKTITVTTLPIVLEGIDLGAFRVILHWERIGSYLPYEVVACEPNCPQNYDNTPHPHVQDGSLCEGKGAAAIEGALSSGRLLDFFVLVRQILTTYNSSSAYVGLDNWYGVACQDCGWSMSSDSVSSCERCEEPLCSECSSSCQECGYSNCSECSISCGKCQEQFCRQCLVAIPGAASLLCHQCQKQGEESDEALEEEPEETEEAAVVAADAVCLGEAAVSA